MIRKLLGDFADRYFHDEESIILLALLGAGLIILLLLGDVLAPLIAALIIAYLMQGLVNLLLRCGLPAGLAFVAVYALFVGLFLLLLLYLLPRIWTQMQLLANEAPGLVAQGRTALMALPERYPGLFSESWVRQFIDGLAGEVGGFGQAALEYSIASLPSLFAWLIFLVLVPILVFFMMKDHDLLVRWAGGFLPRNRPLLQRIWREMDQQIANYVRGKGLEIALVGAAAYVLYEMLGLNYSLLLSVLTGLSVIVPYIGATAVTFPVAAIAYVQWGLGGEFYTALIAYIVLQVLDGNVLVPVIFSEVVNLHPVAIIAAVLVFGGMWGLAGVFFAIPLATLIKAVINAWPSQAPPRAAAPEA